MNNDKLKRIRELIDDLIKENESLKIENSNLRFNIEELQNQNKELGHECDYLTCYVNFFEKKCEELENKKRELEDRVEYLTGKILLLEDNKNG